MATDLTLPSRDLAGYGANPPDPEWPGGAERPGMMTVGLHARLLGRPGRIGALHRILDYMAGFERVWITRREDIARHWMALHPAR